MSDDITMPIAQLAQTMGNRVARERKRIAERLTTILTEGLAINPIPQESLLVVELRAFVLELQANQGGNTFAIPVTADTPLGSRVDDAALTATDGPIGLSDGLPPHREHDDYTEGVALARAHGFRGVSGFAKD